MSKDVLSVRDDILKESGASVVIYGKQGQGKTTLIHNALEYITENWEGDRDSVYSSETPVETYAFAPEDVIKTDYRNYERFPQFKKVHKRKMARWQGFTENSIGVDHKTEGKIVILDDLAVYSSKKGNSDAIERNLVRFLKLERKIGTCIFPVLHSTRVLSGDFAGVLGSLSTVIVTFRKYGVGKFLDRSSIPRRLKKRLEDSGRHEYVVIDTEDETMTEPADYRNPKPMLRAVGGLLDEDADDMVVGEESITLKERIVNLHEEGLDRVDIAERCGCPTSTVSTYLSQEGLLSSGKSGVEAVAEEYSKLVGNGCNREEAVKRIWKSDDFNLSLNSIEVYVSRAKKYGLVK